MISTTSSIDKANIAKLKIFEESIQNELGANMVSRWKLDGDAKDVWGTNHGTNYNVTFPNESECVSGGCASFNGTSYIDFGDILRPSRTEERTYTFWTNLSSYGSTVFSTGNAHFNGNGFFGFGWKIVLK